MYPANTSNSPGLWRCHWSTATHVETRRPGNAMCSRATNHAYDNQVADSNRGQQQQPGQLAGCLIFGCLLGEQPNDHAYVKLKTLPMFGTTPMAWSAWIAEFRPGLSAFHYASPFLAIL